MDRNEIYLNVPSNICRYGVFDLRPQFTWPNMEELRRKYLVQMWTIPPDNRLDLSFQNHILEHLELSMLEGDGFIDESLVDEDYLD